MVGAYYCFTAMNSRPCFPVPAQRTMHICLYKSSFCPRCYVTKKYLLEITAQHPDIDVEIIDVATEPRRSWNEGVRMIPALKIDGDILSALFISRTDITDFINKHKR
ncbi:hypothetical protein FCL47_00925 [Desulfopila sp. IMCC35006]|nr:hypothetical protein FCL47_00925 [Desulfopila sp. IMCC35006]